MNIRELLESVQLENFADAFERENITPDLLKDLTDADLRELGVASMADRKKLQRLAITPGKQHLQPASSGVGPRAEEVFYEGVVQAVPQSKRRRPRSEKEFYEGVEEGVKTDGVALGNVSIRVTSHRAIIGPKTFLLHNIAAVQVGTDEAVSHNTTKIGAICCAVVCFAVAIGIATDGKSEGGVKSQAVTCCTALGLVCLAGLFGKGEPTTYSVRIDSAGTSSDAISSLNKAEMQEIVDAINHAIVNLNVTK